MGLLDYYRQFEGMSEEEVNAELRAVSAERRRLALARVDPLDLSTTTWHQPPHPDVVAAITFAARRALNRAPDPRASELRAELARRHGVEPERIAIGHGADALLTAATQALIDPGDELVTPWPSYPLLPLLARRAGGRAVPVAGFEVERLLSAVNARTRMVVICNPNDPTGAWLGPAALRALADALPERVALIVDEALIDYVGDESAARSSLALLDDHPHVVLVRTFSKAYGLAGMRCGFALGGAGAEELMEEIEPPGGIGSLEQAGALEALLECGPLLAKRRAAVIEQRRVLLDALPEIGVDAAPSQANFLWLAAAGITADDLAAALERHSIRVRSGVGFGDDRHVRAAIHDAPATQRLLRALSLRSA